MKRFQINNDPRLKSLSDEFENWRSQKKSKRERIPERLWSKSIELCKYHPLGRLQRLLGLSYLGLRERVRNRSSKLDSTKSSTFVELKIPDNIPPVGLPDSQYLIELSRPDGSLMKIYSSKNNPIDINNLCSTFLRS